MSLSPPGLTSPPRPAFEPSPKTLIILDSKIKKSYRGTHLPLHLRLGFPLDLVRIVFICCSRVCEQGGVLFKCL